MNLAAFYKLIASIVGPLIAASSAIAFAEKLPLGIGLAVIVASFIFCARLAVRSMWVISNKRAEEAKRKYSGKSFNELKALFLANPREAALLINVTAPSRSDDRRLVPSPANS